MKSRKLFKNLLLITFLFFTFNACGYKSTTSYAKQEISGKVYVDLEINLEDPKNAVLIKDALNELLINKLEKKIVYEKSQADTIMNIKLNSLSLSELSFGDDGYAKLYKSIVSLTVTYNKKDGKQKSITLTGRYDFSIDEGEIISDLKRFEAIKSASERALDELVSKLAVESFRDDE